MSQKFAMVTGGSRGIGASICKRLAKDGFYVYINFSSSEDRAKAVLEEITSSGGSGELCGFNVGDSAQVAETFKALSKKNGPLSVLVNNAGISIDGLLMRLKDEDLDKTLNIDLKGAIYCTREAVKQMIKARAGSIIQISSVIGEMGNAGQTAYSAAKAGLIGFTKAAAREVASRNVRVNAITPGYIQTEMTDSLSDEQKEGIKTIIPLGTLGQTQDIAGAVSFLASDDSTYVTGQILGVNGGMYM